MKNLKYILLLITFLLFNIESFGQSGFPLQQGSIVMTHSPYQGNCTDNVNYTNTILSGSVVRVLNAQNTSNISNTSGNKYVWTNFSTPNPKPLWYSDPSWTGTNLGRVFGLTLDEIGNIYVANTSIYGGELGKNNTIFKLDKTTGSISIVFSLPDTGNSKGIGNIKIFKIGNISYMAATNWDDGKIYILKQPLSGLTASSNWVFVDSIKPNLLTNNGVPYGIAVRPNTLGNFDVYYGVYEINSVTGHHSEINKIRINSSGNFISGSESIVTIPILIQPTLVTNTGITVTGNTPFPISDISFSSDSKRLVIGQQAVNNSQTYQAHNSRTQEFKEISVDNWSSIGKYPSGNTGYAGAFSSVGGVSYWNNVIFEKNKIECDTSIIYSCDLIYLSSAYSFFGALVPSFEVNSPSNNFGLGQTTATVSVYGFQGLPSNNAFVNDISAFNGALKVDANDIYNVCDKWSLGDIEAFNINCTPPCNCGQWENIALNQNANWWNPNSSPTPPTLTFNQGSSTGILFPHYICNGNCAPTFTYSLTSASGATTPLSGTNSLDLSQTAIKNLPCGSYFINITPKCGNVVCPPIRIPLVIVCPPPCNDCGGNASVTSNGTPTISNGTISGNFTINNSKPVSEVRVLVEEFRVTSNNENCLVCKNPPKTWGSIQSATLGTLSPAFSNALTVDNREVVFNNNAVLPLPSNMAINLALPQSVNLSCCEVQVQVCLKFIIRDVNCCEKEVLKCFTFTLPQSK